MRYFPKADVTEYHTLSVYSSVQFSHSVVSDSLRPHESQHARPPCPSPSPGLHPDTSIKLVMPSNHLILCCPLFLLPSTFLSIRVFPSETSHQVAKVWSFSFSISPSSEYLGLIFFRIDWFYLFAVQETLKSLL